MLAELSIDDLVLIAGARLEFSPGLNVITGETGAGKSLLAQAIGLLMGQKGGDELVRPGAARALVQALFEAGDETLAVARELPRGGRSRARMDGLLSSAAAVEEALRRRLAFYGQLEHARLLQLERQLDLLDGAVADEVEPLKAAYSEAFARARALTRELDDLRGAGRDRERELDMLRYQVGEIEAAGVEPGEDERLAVDRERARHAGKLLERTGGALALLAGESEAAALDGVRVAQRLVDEAALLDESVAPLAERLGALTVELDDLAAALRDYIDELDVDAAHRDALELRYDKLKGLMRKYGGSADEVLAYLEEARARLAALEEFAADEDSLVGKVTAAQDQAVAAAARLSEARRRLAPQVAASIEEELRGLAMPHATFLIEVAPRGGGWDGARAVGRRRGGVRLRRQPRRAAAPAARDRLRRRAVAGHARHPRPGQSRRRRRDAHLRRGRHRHRRRDGGGAGGAAAPPGRAPPGPLHHAPAAGRRLRRPAVRHRQGERSARGHHRDRRAPGRGRRAPRRAVPHARRRPRRRGRAQPRREPAREGVGGLLSAGPSRARADAGRSLRRPGPMVYLPS